MDPKVARVFGSFLRPYQRRFLEDRSPRIICLKSRRIGMSEAVVLRALLTALSKPYHDVYLCSTNYTNAKELLRRLTLWISAMQKGGIKLPVVSMKKTEVEFKNGSRVIPMPAMAVRSRTGTVILDEYAFYQWDREVWAGVAPVADTDPTFQVILISTPFGASGIFWEIWNDPEGIHGDWSRHHIDVYQAAAEGFPVNPDALKKKYPSDIWQQEFLCQFMSDINQYFGHDLIRRSQYSEEDLPGFALPSGQRFGGVDLASRQDASTFAEAIKADDTFWVDKIHEIKPPGESMDYTPQFALVDEIVDSASWAGIAVDATGEGNQLGQDLRRKHGRQIITEVNSAAAWGEVYEHIPDLRLAMEQGKYRMPHDSKLRTAFSKIQRTTLANNKVKFEARRDHEGHADEFYATLLAWHAMKRAEATSTGGVHIGTRGRGRSRVGGF